MFVEDILVPTLSSFSATIGPAPSAGYGSLETEVAGNSVEDI